MKLRSGRDRRRVPADRSDLCLALAVVATCVLWTHPLHAQGQPSRADTTDAPARAGADTGAHGMAGMAGMRGMRSTDTVPVSRTPPQPGMRMTAQPLGIPMTRMGSGTSWLPDATAMRAQHMMAGGWQLMVHGLAFATYDDQQGGPRGATQFGSQNWGMFMASHAVGDGRLELRQMMSADAATVTDSGYPLMLQSGEDYNGAPLHDRQHPHDVFMETVADYEAPVTRALGVELYGGPVGEPALGPVAFPHRPSASSDPFAPIGHHWQDATHVSFGVLTAGLFTRAVKLEGSIFNGREPDQHRADIDLATPHHPTLDSYATRLTVNPASAWSLAAWYGYLRSPDQLEPTVSTHRMGASVLNTRPLGSAGQWSSAVIYGANLYSNDRRLSNSVLGETNLDLDGRNTVFARAELVTKSSDDLDIPILPPPASNRFDVASFTLGYVREIGMFTRYGSAGLGALVMLDAIPSTLEPTYHTRTPGGFGLYLRLRPAQVHREATAGMRQGMPM